MSVAFASRRSRDSPATDPGGMVELEGLEPPTSWFEAKRSIQLSYSSDSPPFT